MRILAIDGGGIRGIVPATVLAYLESRIGKRVSEMFDLIAGTSTGGILALGLAKPGQNGKAEYSASDLQGIYREHGETIFPRSIWRKLWTGWGLAEEKYPVSGLERVLQGYFGTRMLSESVVPVMATAYELTESEPWFFRSERAREHPGWDFPMWQVARATSAAPTYFEPARIRGRSLVDGGVYANNPALCALVDALPMLGREPVTVVSLGTGERTPQVNGDAASGWGAVRWLRPVVEVMFDGGSKAVDHQMRAVSGAIGEVQYVRFQFELPARLGAMDRVGKYHLSELEELTKLKIAERSADFEGVEKVLRGSSASNLRAA